MSATTESVPPPGYRPEAESQPSGSPPASPSRRPRRLPGRQALIILAGLIALAGAAAALSLISQGAPAARSLVGASFTTRYPAGWTMTVTRPIPGVASYALGSSSGKLNGLSIPAPGEIGITVGEYSLDTFAAKADPAAPAQSPLALLPRVIGIPRAATSPQLLRPLHPTSLSGGPAAAITYRYTYDGVRNLQSDVVARHGASIVSIEMDAEPGLAPQAESAMAGILHQWRWRKSQAVSSSSHGVATAPISAPRTTDIAGYYQVLGRVLSSQGLSAERAGTSLFRDWSIRKTCQPAGCGFILIRDVAGVSGNAPISGILRSTNGGWTTHFVQTGRCTSPGATGRSTEHSTWRLSATRTGVEAIEHGYAPTSDGCAGYRIVIHWYATRLSPSP